MTNKMLTAGGLVLAVVLLFALNIFSGAALTTSRLDMTEGKLYTLSEGTRNVLAGLEEPVTIRLYLSQSLATRVPGVSGYAARVRDLLEEYARESNGKLILQVIDPEPFSAEEDRAVGLGLRGVPLNDGEDVLYFGLVGTNSTDDEEVIPFLSSSREEFLEYDLTKLVYNLSNPRAIVVGLLSTLPMEGEGPRPGMPVMGSPQMGSPPWMIVDQMRQLFDVRPLSPELDEIPPDVDVLMLVHPKGLGERALYAIDQFVLRGGRALIFVDPNADGEQVTTMGAMMVAPGARASDLEVLLPKWGVRLLPDAVIGDLEQAVTVRMQRGGRMITFDYPVWINAQPPLFDQNDIVTGQLGNIAFGTPGALEAVDGVGTEFTPLIRTSDTAARIGLDKVTMQADPQDMLREYQPEGAFVLAARVSGEVETAFPDGPPPKAEAASGDAGDSTATEEAGEKEETDATAHLERSQEDVNLIVVADTDLLMDRFWVDVQDLLGTRIAVPTAANGSLVVNALDNLAGSNDLISVRNRGSYLRPFDRVNELRQEAELRYREKEQELMQRLDETERRLVELEDRKQGEEGLILSQEQQDALIQFRQERVRIRKDLRDVRHELRKSIETLEGWLKFVNIGLIPLLIGLGGLVAGLWQLKRHRPVEGAAG